MYILIPEKSMKKFTIRLWVTWMCIASSVAWAACDEMVAWGMPQVRTTIESPVLCRRMYVLEHNNIRHTAWWSAEKVVGSQQGIEQARVNAFKTDPDLPKEVASKPSDYAGSKFDQGHLAPVGDMHADPEAMIESFYLSNIVPQAPANNRAGWRSLEGYVRAQAAKKGVLFVITGPIYQGIGERTIGETKVAVPSHLYKIIYDPSTHNALTFVVPNIPAKWLEFTHFISDVATVEQLTGIIFFPLATTPIKNSYIMW